MLRVWVHSGFAYVRKPMGSQAECVRAITRGIAISTVHAGIAAADFAQEPPEFIHMNIRSAQMYYGFGPPHGDSYPATELDHHDDNIWFSVHEKTSARPQTSYVVNNEIPFTPILQLWLHPAGLRAPHEAGDRNSPTRTPRTHFIHCDEFSRVRDD